MIGTTLNDLREYIESLASASGRYSLVCGRTGISPVPADGLCFENRAVARSAGRATEQYRATLRRYDPQLPYYDVIVCENPPTVTLPGSPRVTDADERSGGQAASQTGYDRDGGGQMIDFCHTVAGAVFEAIASSAHNGLEEAVMDTYLEVAETIERPDELCVRLLESIATELDERLTPAQQAQVLADAADSLPTDADRWDHPGSLEDVLCELQAAGLLESGRIDRWSIEPDSGSYSWSVQLEGYAFGVATEEIVTLPIVVALLARLSSRSLTITGVERTATSSPPTWRLTIAVAGANRPQGLLRVRGGESA